MSSLARVLVIVGGLSLLANVLLTACTLDASGTGNSGGSGGAGGNGGAGGSAGRQPTSDGGAGAVPGGTAAAGGADAGNGSGGQADLTQAGAGGISSDAAGQGGAGVGGETAGAGGALQGSCPFPSSYGKPPAGGTAEQKSLSLVYSYNLNTATPPDTLQLQLFSGLGLFPDGLKTGTYEIKGDELNYETCSLCLIILGDYSESDNGISNHTDTYFVTGGSISLTSVAGRLTGLLSSATFEHVTLDASNGFHSTPLNDGCVTSIDTLTFDAPIP